MMKKLVRHGNTFAIPIDKKTLAAANLGKDVKFEVTIVPGGGIHIQSVEEIDRELISREFDEISSKYDRLFKRLSKK